MLRSAWNAHSNPQPETRDGKEGQWRLIFRKGAVTPSKVIPGGGITSSPALCPGKHNNVCPASEETASVLRNPWGSWMAEVGGELGFRER